MACIAKTDIRDRSDIALIITTFYEAVRKDPALGYLFDDVAKVHWETHTPLIIDFWEATVLGTIIYTRNAMAPHFDLHAKSPLTPLHFSRWLLHFHTVVDRLYRGPRADLMKQRADGIAGLMQHKLGLQATPQENNPQ